MFPLGGMAFSSSCLNALQALFSEKVSPDQASEFLKLQGNITLNRLAWAYLKVQENDQTQQLENIERSILTLLDEKYTSTDQKFIQARDAFESQPLSRSTLADIAPYLKDVLSAEYGTKDKAYVLNSSDLKLLHTLAKFERNSVKNGKYDSRMLTSKSPQGVLSFLKLINSTYKSNPSHEEEALNVELNLAGLEKTLLQMQKRVIKFLNQLEKPTQCNDEELCSSKDLGEIFQDNQAIQEIFWKSLEDKLLSDDLILDNLTYGEIWLNLKTNSSPSSRKTKIGETVKSSPKSFVNNFYTSNTGLLISDPISIIVKEGQQRKAEDWEKFDEKYLRAMADAILGDDKVFIIDGKIYNRSTGKVMSAEKALEFLPPKARADFKLHLKNSNSPFKAAQICAKVNGDKTFIFNNHLYNLEGKIISPEWAIADQMNKKIGIKREPSAYKGMEKSYLLLRSNALMNNKPHFVIKSEVFDTESGRQISSPFRSSFKLQNAKVSKERRIEYQKLSDEETIVNFHRDRSNKNGCQYYAIVNKKEASLTVHHLSGKEVMSMEVLLGINISDKVTTWSQYNDREHLASGTTGAGIYSIGRPKTNEDIKKKYSNNLMQIDGQKVFAIHQIPNNLQSRYSKFGTGDPLDRRVSGGCVNLKKSDYLKLQDWIKPSCQIYVLPEESQNKFIVKDGELRFAPTNYVSNSNRYNYSSSKSKYHPIDIRIINEKGRSKHSLAFIEALETQKKKLMSIFNISNDDYNDLASLAYGIMGNESDFGRSVKYWIKEYDQGDVILAKAAKRLVDGKNPFDKSVLNTSRGFTQIKNLPEGEWKKHYPGVNKETLSDPKNSAVATIAYLVDAVGILKKIAAQNSKDPKKTQINRENLVDYLGYIYQGRQASLKSRRDPANADFNTYIQKLRKNMSYIEIAQKID